MLSTEEARRVVAEHLHMLPPERVSLAAADGRVLRAPLLAENDLPPFDRSAFDGYALRARTAAARLRLAGSIAAGNLPTSCVEAEECARIFTGAPVPSGADAVAMQEVCRSDGEWVDVPPLSPGQGVRRKGEDARAGDVLVHAGARLAAVELSLLAQLGHTQPLVSPRPRVFHVRTGDEIVPPEAQPSEGQIRDSNSTLLAALVSAAGAEPAGHATAADRLDSLVEACAGAEDSDLLLISGGASVGDFDFGRDALRELGFSARFAGLNLRPGKPLVFATRGRQAAFVLPGNPLSHFVCWHLVVRAALDVLTTGVTALHLVEMELAGSAELPGHARETWWPARTDFQAGRALATPLKWQSSGDMTGLAGVDALIRIPSKSAALVPGAIVSALRV